MAAHGWIRQFQLDFCLCGRSLCAKLNVCHGLFIHSHENQVIFMWNVLHEHSMWGKQQLRSESKVCSPSQEYPNIKFASTYLYTWMKRGSVRVKCHNTMYNVKRLNTMFPETARNRKEIQKSNNRLLNNFKITRQNVRLSSPPLSWVRILFRHELFFRL